MYGFGHGWMYDGSGWGWMIVGWLWMALVMLTPFLIILAVAKYLFSRQGRSASRRSRALEILDEAYARGEIEREAYLQKRADLQER